MYWNTATCVAAASSINIKYPFKSLLIERNGCPSIPSACNCPPANAIHLAFSESLATFMASDASVQREGEPLLTLNGSVFGSKSNVLPSAS